MDELNIVNIICEACKDYINNNGYYDITMASLEYTMLILMQLSRININAIAKTAWYKPFKESTDRVLIYYAVIKIENKNYYTYLLSESIIDEYKTRKLRKYKHKMIRQKVKRQRCKQLV